MKQIFIYLTTERMVLEDLYFFQDLGLEYVRGTRYFVNELTSQFRLMFYATPEDWKAAMDLKFEQNNGD